MRKSTGLSLTLTVALIQLVLTTAPVLSFHAAARRFFDFARTVDYLEPANWRSGAPPCPRDTARLPNTAGTPPLIGLSAPVSPRELLLPARGSGETGLVMFEGAELGAFDTGVASTPGCGDVRIREANFNFTAPADWFHPGSWRRREGSGGSAEGGGIELFDALPVDRVPGACDAVKFQARSVYWVRVLGSGDSVPVGELTFSGRTFSADKEGGDFSEYWRGSARSYLDAQFARLSPAADAGTTSEEDSSGSTAAPPIAPVGAASVDQCETPLPVQNPGLMKRVCADIGEQKICRLGDAALLNCPHPVNSSLIVGACCDLCGFGVTLKAESGLFNLRLVKAEMVKLARRLGASGKTLRLSAFRTSVQEATYQIVVVCASGGGSACGAALREAMNWLQNMGTAMHYRIINGTFHAEKPSSRSSSAGLARWYSVSLLIVVLLALAAFLIVCYRRGWLQNPRTSLLSWWQRRPRTLHEEAAASVDKGDSAVAYAVASQSVAMSFSNPAFDVSQPESICPTERSTVVEQQQEEAAASREM